MKNKQEEFTKKEEDSIIDISGLNYKIPKKDNFTSTTMSKNKSNNNLINAKKGVPDWEYRHIYYYDEITQTTPKQQEFYTYLRDNFNENRYIDVEDNINYLSVLILDLMRDYKSYDDIHALEANFKRLGENYYDVKGYVDNIILRLKEEEERINEAKINEERIKAEEYRRVLIEQMRNFSDNYYYQNYGLGSKYKDDLELNEEEVDILDFIDEPNNNFFNIPIISHQIMRLFLDLIFALEEKYEKEKTTLDDVIEDVSDIITRKHFNRRKGSQPYNMYMEDIPEMIYQILFSHTENRLRQHYGYKRKLTVTTFEKMPQTELETKIVDKAQSILNELVKNVKELDNKTDRQLYSIDASRWKIKYKEIKSDYENKHKSVDKFTEEFFRLAELNQIHMASYKNMFFDAAKYMTVHNKEKAIILYLNYIFYGLRDAAKTKEFTKKDQKLLFKTEEELNKFTIIKEEVIKNRQLEIALEKVPSIYYVERKKIKLDTTSIKQVQQSHSETVEILNEYLQDEKEINQKEINQKEATKVKAKKETQKSTKKVENKTQNKAQSTTNYLSELQLNDAQKMVLDYFSNHKFSISKQAFEKLATQNGTFKNQLLESINEKCYEILDDVLIEENENYTIYEAYYQKLIKN